MMLESRGEAPSPPPPPRRRKNCNADQQSSRTASADWIAPAFKNSASETEHPERGDYDDDVSMRGLDTNLDGKEEKKSTINTPIDQSTKVGAAKVARELRVEKNLPYGATHKERLSRVIYISMIIFTIIFFANAIMVSLALWRMAAIQPGDVVIHRIEVAELDQPTSRLTVLAELPQRWYHRVFNVIVHPPTIVQIFVPEAVKREEDRWVPLLTLKVPRIDIGRGGHKIDWRAIPLDLNRAVSLRNLIEYFGASEPKNPRSLDIRVEFEVETTSYWIPIRFSHSIQQTIELPPVKSGTNLEIPHLESIEFINDRGPEVFSIKTLIRYPKRDIPDFLFIHIPELYVQIGHFTTDPGKALEKNTFGQVKLLPHILSKSCKDGDQDYMSIEAKIKESNKKSAVTLLERLRDGDFDWSVAIGAEAKAEDSHLQKWLSTLSYESSLLDLMQKIELPSEEKFFFKREEKTNRAAIDVGLVEIDDSGPKPKFVAKVSIGHGYLEELLGNSFSLSGMIRGKLPKITFKVLVDKGDLAQGPIEVFIIDLIHVEPSGEPKTDLLVYITLADVSSVVKAGHKYATLHHMDKIAEELGEYRAVLLRVSGNRVLDSLLRVFEVQWTLNHGGGLYFKRGIGRKIKLPTDEAKEAVGGGGTSANQVKHHLSLDVATDKDAITATGRISFAKKPSLNKPHLQVYWEAMDVSFYPVRSRQLDHIELMHLSVKKGRARMLMAGLSPLQLIHHGSFDFVLSVRPTETLIKGEPALIAAWRHMSRLWATPVFPPVQVVGRIGSRKLDFETCFPPRSTFLKEKTNVPRLVTDVIKTRVKIAGFYEATLQVLLELPRLGTCSRKLTKYYKTALGISISLPAINANGCLYPTRRKSKKEKIKCIAKVGLHPIRLDLALLDGRFCDITTRLAKPHNYRHRRESNAKSSKSNLESTINGKFIRKHLFFAREEDKAESDEALINFIPFSVAVTNLRVALEAMDRLAVTGKLRKIKASLGFTDRKALQSKETSLLDRLLNGVGQLFPLSLPLYSKKKRPRTRPPVGKLYGHRPLSVQVDVHSPNRTIMSGRVIIKVPKASLPGAIGRHRLPRKQSLAFLLSLQWGKTLMTLRYKRMWLKMRVSQGQATFRLDENRILLGRHHGIPTTPKVVIEFAMRAHPKDFSSATMRRMLSHMHNFVSRRAGDRTSKRVMSKLPKRYLEFEIHTTPFVANQSKETDCSKGKKFSKRSRIRRRRKELRKAKSTRDRLKNLVLDKESYAHQLPHSPKQQSLKQRLPLNTLLEFWLMGWKHLSKSQKAPKLNYSLVIHPKGHPGVREYHLPCFIPTICDPKELHKSPPKGQFMYANVSLFNIVQPAVDMAAWLLGGLLDKLNFRRHPKHLHVGVRLSRMAFALAINDMDAVQVGVEPLKITRRALLRYPGRKRSKPKKKVDVEVVVVDIGLPKRIGLIGELFIPWRFDPTMALKIDPVPVYRRGGRRVPVHYSPINISLSNERLDQTNLLSSIASMVFPERNVSPVFSWIPGLKVPIKLVKTTNDEMQLVISGIKFVSPIRFASIVMDEPITYRYLFKGYEFVRVRVGKMVVVPGPNPLTLHATVSKTAFGKLKASKVSPFIPEFSEFMCGLAMGDPLKATAIVELSKKFRLRLNVSFPKRTADTGAFNPEVSHVDFRDLHELLSMSFATPAATWQVAKTVGTRLHHDVGQAWDWTKSWTQPVFDWATQKWKDFTGGGTEEHNRKEIESQHNKDKRGWERRQKVLQGLLGQSSQKQQTGGRSNLRAVDQESLKTHYKRGYDDDDDKVEDNVLQPGRRRTTTRLGGLGMPRVTNYQSQNSNKKQITKPPPSSNQSAMAGSGLGGTVKEYWNWAWEKVFGTKQPTNNNNKNQSLERASLSPGKSKNTRNKSRGRSFKGLESRGRYSRHYKSDSGSGTDDESVDQERPDKYSKIDTDKESSEGSDHENLDTRSAGWDGTRSKSDTGMKRRRAAGLSQQPTKKAKVTEMQKQAAGSLKSPNPTSSSNQKVSTRNPNQKASDPKRKEKSERVSESKRNIASSGRDRNIKPRPISPKRESSSDDEQTFPVASLVDSEEARRDSVTDSNDASDCIESDREHESNDEQPEEEATDNSGPPPTKLGGEKVTNHDEMVNDLVLGKDGALSSNMLSSYKSRLNKMRNYHRQASPTIDFDEPNKERKVPKEWKEKLQRSKKAKVHFLKQQNRSRKRRRMESRKSVKTLKKFDQDFDKDWRRAKEKEKKKEKAKRHHKRGLPSSSGEEQEEEGVSISDDRGRAAKSKSKKINASSRSTKADIHKSFKSKGGQVPKNSKKKRSSSPPTTKSWRQIWEELKKSGRESYARLIENMERGYYHIGLKNDLDFNMMVVGLKMHLHFQDKEGRLYSKLAKNFQAALGPLKGDAFGRLLLAPPACVGSNLSDADYLNCVNSHVRESPIVIPPRHVMSAGECGKASVVVPNIQTLPLLLDQGLFRDGMCVAVESSLITFGLQVPGGQGKKMHPFVADLLVTLDSIEQPNTPFSDPCHNSLKCLPTPTTDLHDRFIFQRLSGGGSSVGSKFVKSQGRTNKKSKESFKSLNNPKKATKTQTANSPKSNFDDENGSVTRMWSHKKIPTIMNLVIHFRFRLSFLSKWLPGSMKAGPERPGWALVFYAGKKAPKIRRRSDYGYVGLENSVALVCDPLKNRLAIYKNGDSHPLFIKETSPFPPELANAALHRVIVQYRPREKVLAVAISKDSSPLRRFVSTFPVDMISLLSDAKEMSIGFTMATANYAVTSIDQVSLRAPLADLPRTRIYHVGNFSILPHERGMFLLELRDNCNKILPLSPVGIQVKLRRIKPKRQSSLEDSAGGSASDSIAAHPDDQPITCKVKALPSSGVYKIFYRPALPGRYRIFISLKRHPRALCDGPPSLRRRWYRIKDHHIYVRNLW